LRTATIALANAGLNDATALRLERGCGNAQPQVLAHGHQQTHAAKYSQALSPIHPLRLVLPPSFCSGVTSRTRSRSKRTLRHQLARPARTANAGLNDATPLELKNGRAPFLSRDG